MDLQHELALLRKSVNVSPSHDVKRFETSLDSLSIELEEKESRICELEDFIVEQDEVRDKVKYHILCQIQIIDWW